MHLEVEQFLRSRLVATLPWTGAFVLEVGAFDNNGSARDHVPEGWAMWDGVDLEDGPGVTHVGDALVILPTLHADGQRYDIALCTEVLEHAEQWRDIIRGMVALVRPGGGLVVTCAGPGRAPHGATGAPLPAPGEWYENVDVFDLDEVVTEAGLTVIHAASIPVPGDTHLVAVRSA